MKTKPKTITYRLLTSITHFIRDCVEELELMTHPLDVIMVIVLMLVSRIQDARRNQ